jgi:hypothetical protein
MAKKKEVAQDEVQKELPLATESTAKETPVVVDVAADAKRAIVHEDEVGAIKDSRKRDLPLFKIVKQYCLLWDVLHEAAGELDTGTELYHRVSEALDDTAMWIVAVSEHQAKLAIIDYAYPMEKVSKKDRDYRYLHLLESAAETSKE